MVETDSTARTLGEMGRQLLESDMIWVPEQELVLRVIGMMDRTTTRQNIINIVNQLIDDFGGVEQAIDAIIEGAVELEWNSIV